MNASDLLIPYSLKSDDWIAIVLLICFIMSCFVLMNSRKYLMQQGKNFFLHKERTNLFVASPALNSYFSFLLFLQTCLLLSVFLFGYFNYDCPNLVQEIPTYLLIGIYTLACVFFVLFKWVVYAFIGWIFSDKSSTRLWLDSYSTVVFFLGFILFPYSLLLVYIDLDIQIMLGFGFLILIFTKILMLYKWLKFFFNNIYGLSLLILYFCALEIIPCLLLYRVLVDINNSLLIKF